MIGPVRATGAKYYSRLRDCAGAVKSRWCDRGGDEVDPVRATIAEQYGGLLAACDSLRDYAIAMKSPSWGGRGLEEESPHEQLLAMILSRSLNTYWSAIELARIGFGAQAAMLNRSLFEDMVDAHWITIEPELAAQRIEEHHLHGQMLLADAARAQGIMSDDELPTFDAERRKELDKVFGAYGQRSWTGLGIHDRVMAIEQLWEPVEGGRELLHFYRRLVHRESNQILHLSAFSMGEQIRERTETELALALGPSNQYVGKALIAAFWCFVQLLSLIRDTFDFGDAKGWRAVSDVPANSLKAAGVDVDSEGIDARAE